MAIVRKGLLSVLAGGSAQNLGLGFVPSYIRLENKTKIIGGTDGVQIAEWYDDNDNASAYLWTTTSGAPVISYESTNGITPFATGSPDLYTPTNLTITGISQAANASITATHNFTANDIGVTVVSFHSVVGMTQINTLTGVVQTVTATTSFTVNINSSSFSTYGSGGIANVVTGRPALMGGVPGVDRAPGFPPSQANTSQVLNTALFNAGIQGLTLGSAIMVTTDDVWQFVAYLDAPFTS